MYASTKPLQQQDHSCIHHNSTCIQLSPTQAGKHYSCTYWLSTPITMVTFSFYTMHLSVQFNHFNRAHWVAVRCEASEATPAVAETSEASCTNWTWENFPRCYLLMNDTINTKKIPMKFVPYQLHVQWTTQREQNKHSWTFCCIHVSFNMCAMHGHVHVHTCTHQYFIQI